jgi:predicted nucleic acid-binding protein
MSVAIVDASVAVKWFVPEEHSDTADRLAEAGWTLLAPRLVLAEVANAFWKKVSRRLMTAEDGQEHLTALPRFFDHLIDTEELLSSALSLACTFNHPVYDFIYVTAARQRDAVLVTADHRLAALLRGSDYARHVVHLAGWTPEAA